MLARRLPPAVAPVNCQFGDGWVELVTGGWTKGEDGDISACRRAYMTADMDLPGSATLCPDLSVLRHTIGEGVGQVENVTPTENQVHSLFLMSPYTEQENSTGLQTFEYRKHLEGGIRAFMKQFDPGYFGENIPEPREHVFVMSTGRCGTVSLYKMFRDSNLCPYHTYWFHPSIVYAYEFMCRLVDRRWKDPYCWGLWMKCRAAEWLGDRPMMALNHTDTIYAPVFAALHPKAKFIHLHRNKADTFESFYTKNQFGEGNLRKIRYAINNDFRWRRAYDTDVADIDWYLDFTKFFARTMGNVLGSERFAEISSDKLFAQDEDEVRRLLEFTGSDVPLDTALTHFGTKHNEKAHKVTRPYPAHWK